MTNAQYNCFMTVVETGSFSEAARVMFVAQPAISKQIHAMEEELSVKLFHRKGHTIGLTTEGAIFYNMVKENKRNYDSTVLQIQTMAKAGSRLQVAIGCPIFWNREKSYQPIESWQKKSYPWYDLELHAYSQQEILSRVADGTLDVAIHTEDAKTQEGLITEPFSSTGTLLLFSSRSPLVKQPELLKQEGAFTLVTTFNLDQPLYQELKQMMMDAMGVKQLKTLLADDISKVYSMLENPSYMFMASEFSLWKNDPLLRYLTLPVPRKMFLARRANEARPDILFFVEHMVREFREFRNL